MKWKLGLCRDWGLPELGVPFGVPIVRTTDLGTTPGPPNLGNHHIDVPQQAVAKGKKTTQGMQASNELLVVCTCWDLDGRGGQNDCGYCEVYFIWHFMNLRLRLSQQPSTDQYIDSTGQARVKASSQH